MVEIDVACAPYTGLIGSQVLKAIGQCRGGT